MHLKLWFVLILTSLCLQAQAFDPPEAWRQFISKAVNMLEEGQQDSANAYIAKALEQTDNRSDSVRCYSTLGYYCYKEGLYQEAIPIFENAIEFHLDTLEETLTAHYYRARSLFLLGETPKKTLDAYRQSIRIADKVKTPYTEYQKGNSLIKVGQYYAKIGEVERAKVCYLQALEIGQRKEHQHKSLAERCFIELGIIYWVELDFSAAITHYHKALSIDHIKPTHRAHTYDRLGETYTSLKKYEEALLHLEKAISIYQASEEEEEMLKVQASQAEVLLKMGRYAEAESLLVEVFTAWRNLESDENTREFAKMQLVAGETYLAQKKYDQALSHYQKALQAVVKDSLGLSADPRVHPTHEMIYAENVFQDGLNGKGKAFLARYQAEKDVQDLQTAFSAFTLAMAVDDTLRKEFSATSSKSILATETHWRTGFALETVKLLEKETGDSMVDTVFTLLEHSRAMDLYGTLIEAQASIEEGIPPELRTLRAEMRMALSACKSRWAENDAVFIDSACALVRHQLDSLDQALEKDFPTYHLKKFQFDMKRLAVIQEKLKEDQALIEYFWGKETLIGLIVTKSRADWKQLGKSTEVAALLEKLNFAQYTSPAQTAQPLYELYSRLLAPFGSLPKHLILIPDDSLHHLPFEALLTHPPTRAVQLDADFWKGQRVDKGADYLLYHHQVQYAHSATLLFLNKKKETKGSNMAVFAPTYTATDSFQHQQIESWPGNEAHAHKLAELMNAKAYVGPQADSTTFVQHAAQYDLLHLALHGYADVENPLLAALAFSSADGSKGIVNAATLYGLPPMQAELVSLLSCETGAGQYARGEGIMSLARAFRYAGANSVLMSLWQAETGQGVKLMESFYQYLKNGMDKSAALQQAKIDWLADADGISAQPAQWASFVLIGNADSIARRPSRWPYVLGGILLLTALLLWWRRG